MTAPGALEAALACSRRGWPIFPCREREPKRKRPYTPHGFRDASCETATIDKWWQCWPNALIGLPTGKALGAVVLDIDVRDDKANGFGDARGSSKHAAGRPREGSRPVWLSA
jgi:hypothetical protein